MEQTIEQRRDARWLAKQRRAGSDDDAPTLEKCEELTRRYLRGTNPLLRWNDLPHEEQAQLLSTWRGFYSQRLNAQSGDDVLGRIADEARRSALRDGIKITPVIDAEFTRVKSSRVSRRHAHCGRGAA